MRAALATPIIAVLTIPKRASLIAEAAEAIVAPLGPHAERAAERGTSMTRAATIRKQKVSQCDGATVRRK